MRLNGALKSAGDQFPFLFLILFKNSTASAKPRLFAKVFRVRIRVLLRPAMISRMLDRATPDLNESHSTGFPLLKRVLLIKSPIWRRRSSSDRFGLSGFLRVVFLRPFSLEGIGLILYNGWLGSMPAVYRTFGL